MLRQSVKDLIPNKIYSRSNKSDLSPPIDKFFFNETKKKLFRAFGRQGLTNCGLD